MDVEAVGERGGLETWCRASHPGGGGTKRKIQRRSPHLLVRSRKRNTGRLPNDDGIARHAGRGKEVLVTRRVKVQAVGVKTLGQKTRLMELGSDGLGEVVAEGLAKSQRGDVVHVHDAAEAVSQVFRLPDGAQAVTGRARLAGPAPSFVAFGIVMHPAFGPGTPASPSTPAYASSASGSILPTPHPHSASA